MADWSQERVLDVDKLEDDLGAHGDDELVVIPVGWVLGHKGGPQPEEVRGEAPGQVVAGPGVHHRQSLHISVLNSYTQFSAVCEETIIGSSRLLRGRLR